MVDGQQGQGPRMPGPSPGLDPQLLQQAGIDVEALRRTIRRRLTLLVVGLLIAIASAWIEPSAWNVPEVMPVLVGVTGAAIATLGLLGLRHGMGCLAQILAISWLAAWSCGLEDAGTRGVQILAGATLLAAIAGVVLRRRGRRAPGAKQPGRGRSEAEAVQVIDVQARELDDEGTSASSSSSLQRR